MKKWDNIIDFYFSIDLATAYRAEWNTLWCLIVIPPPPGFLPPRTSAIHFIIIKEAILSILSFLFVSLLDLRHTIHSGFKFLFRSIEHFTASLRKTSNFDICLLNLFYTYHLSLFTCQLYEVQRSDKKTSKRLLVTPFLSRRTRIAFLAFWRKSE